MKLGGGDFSKCENCQKILLKQKNFLSIFGFLCVIFSFIFISQKILFPSFYALIPTLGAALVIFNYDAKTYLAKFLSFKPTVFIGKISYSLYLWHWPVFVLARKYLFVENFVSFKQYFIAILTTFILALLTYFLVETPCRKYKKSFKFSFIVYYLIPSLLILGTYYAHKKTKFLNFRYEKRMELYKLQKAHYNSKGKMCIDKILDNCVFGNKSKKPEILLIGDSQSGFYTNFLDEAGKKYGFSFEEISVSGCSFIQAQVDKKLRLNHLCADRINYIKNKINNFKVVIWAAYLPYYFNNLESNNILDKLPEFIDYLKSNNRKVIVLEQIPILDKSEYERFLDFYLKGRKFVSNKILTQKEIPYNNLIRDITKQKNILTLNPLQDLNQDSKNKWPIYKGLISYMDDFHLNEFVTRQWAKEVLPKQKDFWEGILKIIDDNSTK